MAAAVALLSWIGFWQVEFLKETLYWFVTAGLALFGRSVSEAAPIEDWKATARQQFGIIVLLAFIVNSYTFGLAVELLLVPVVTLLALLAAVAQLKKEHAPAARAIEFVQVGLGLLILSAAFLQALRDYASLATLSTLRAFLLPMVLTTLAVPFMYSLALYAQYDKIRTWTGSSNHRI